MLRGTARDLCALHTIRAPTARRTLESCMRILVTGHEGYLGSVLVPRLIDAGHEVVGLDTGLFADCVIGPAPQAVRALRVDLRDVTAEHLTEVAPDAVMHLAALC